MFGGACFQSAVLIWQQSKLDFFFIDWERQKFDSRKLDEASNPRDAESKSMLSKSRQDLNIKLPSDNPELTEKIKKIREYNPEDKYRVVVALLRKVPGVICSSLTNSTSCLAKDTSTFR